MFNHQIMADRLYTFNVFESLLICELVAKALQVIISLCAKQVQLSSYFQASVFVIAHKVFLPLVVWILFCGKNILATKGLGFNQQQEGVA